MILPQTSSFRSLPRERENDIFIFLFFIFLCLHTPSKIMLILLVFHTTIGSFLNSIVRIVSLKLFFVTDIFSAYKHDHVVEVHAIALSLFVGPKIRRVRVFPKYVTLIVSFFLKNSNVEQNNQRALRCLLVKTLRIDRKSEKIQIM